MTAFVQGIRSANWHVSHGVYGLSRRALTVAVMVVAISLVPQGWSIAIDAMSTVLSAMGVD